MNHLRILTVAALAAFALGCATSSQVDVNRVNLIRVGQTTKGQVQTWFGAPTDRRISSQGEVWVYRTGAGAARQTASTAGGIAKSAGSLIPGGGALGKLIPSGSGGSSPSTVLTIEFDQNGVVSSRDYQQTGG